MNIKNSVLFLLFAVKQSSDSDEIESDEKRIFPNC